jgi:putative nucleotidyltransferase with HDIG domain
MTTAPTTTRDGILATFPELLGIEDATLRENVADIWIEVLAESAWERLEDVPKNPYGIPASENLVAHTRAVTRLALAVAEVTKELRDVPYDRDELIATANLHDVSKLMEFEPSESGGQASRFGHLIQHGTYGAHKMWQKGLPIEMVHNILAHTFTSRYVPQTWEAVIVHYVDYLDSDGLNLVHGAKLNIKK